MRIRPEPTEDEAAAIAAAIDMAMASLTPKPPVAMVSPDWRFRDRWWSTNRRRGR